MILPSLPEDINKFIYPKEKINILLESKKYKFLEKLSVNIKSAGTGITPISKSESVCIYERNF